MRWVIEKIIILLSFFLRSRKIRPELKTYKGKVCVNLGCGLTVAPRWINVDGSLNALIAGWPYFILRLAYRFSGSSRYFKEEEYCDLLKNNYFVFHDLSKSLPFKDASVDIFYSSHFLEHLFYRDAKSLLVSMKSALTVNGMVRIAIPDLEYAVSLYHKGKVSEMLDNYFFVDSLGSYYARHKYMYDFNSLKYLLVEAGFKNIKKCAYQQGLCPDLDTLDKWPEVTLFVEATI